MSLKKDWELIKLKVDSTKLLDEHEKENVIEALDNAIGTYLIEDEYPIEMGTLTPNEFAFYSKILKSLNEGQFKAVKNEKEYNQVVKKIMGMRPNKETQNHIILMDLAFQDGDWKEVNKHLMHISELI